MSYLHPQVHPVELPRKCIFLAEPDLDQGCLFLTNWAGVYGAIGSQQKLSVIDKEVAASYGAARSLNGSVDYIYCDNYSAIDVTEVTPQDPLCVFGMINVDPGQTASTGYILCKNTSSYNDVQYGYYVTPTAISVWINGAQRATSPNVITKGKWQFVGFTFDGLNVNVYVNGQNVRSTPYIASIVGGASNFAIGRRAPGAGYLKGLFGVQGVTRTPFYEINEWAKLRNVYKRYGIVERS